MKSLITRWCRTRYNYATALMILVLAVAALAVPIFSVDSSSSKPKATRVAPEAKTKSRAVTASWFLSPFAVAGETIEVFAADCITPKLDFNLGETVCAKTDGVDLTVPGNYYVNWHGPNGITNGATITQNPQTFLFSLPTSNTEVGLWKPNIGRVAPAETSIIGNPPNFTVSEGPAVATFASDCTTPKTGFVLGETVCARISGEPLGPPVQRRFTWVNSAGLVASSTDVTTDPRTNSFTLSNSASARGAWLVNSTGNEVSSPFALTRSKLTSARSSAKTTSSPGCSARRLATSSAVPTPRSVRVVTRTEASERAIR